MKKRRNAIIRKCRTIAGVVIIIIGGVFLSACAKKEETAGKTPEQVLECTMQAVKALDMESFNRYTDNYVRTHRKNLLGIPTRIEYRMFNEIQQPKLIKGRVYKANYKFSELFTENLTWTIGEVKEEGNKAKISIEITNTDMSDVMGNYMISIYEGMLSAEGTGIMYMLKSLNNIDYDKGRLITLMKEAEGAYTSNITVTAHNDEGQWRIHIDDEFKDAVLGNFGSDSSEDIEKRIEELEKEYEEKLGEWEEEAERKIEEWGARAIDRNFCNIHNKSVNGILPHSIYNEFI